MNTPAATPLSATFSASEGLLQPGTTVSMPVARLHIFKAGLHTSGNGITRAYSAAELAACAAAYDPRRYPAPLVVGHPSDNTPAYGWVARLVAEGDDLYAEVGTIDPLLADAIRVGMYRKISASLYLPESAVNPVPGVLYLRHVGLLGGAAPAVKGLTPVTLAEADGVAHYTEDCAKGHADRPLFLQPKQGVPAMPDPNPNPEPAELQARLAAIEADNASLKAAADAATAALMQYQREAVHAEHLAFAQSLAKAGKLTPAAQKVFVAALDHLAQSSAQFAEGDQQKPLAKALCEALATLPTVIPMGEVAANHSQPSPLKTIDQMSGHEAAALFQRDPQAFRRAAGLSE